MYLGLCVAVVVVWLWLAGGSLYAWRRQGLGGSLALLTGLTWTGIAGLVLLFVGPYWHAVYQILGQPG